MQLQMITLRGVKLDESVYELQVSTASGDIAVFPGHEPLVSIVKPGVAAVRRNKGDHELEYFAISGGILTIEGDVIQMLVDEAAHGDEIIEAESQAALERAMKLRDSASDKVTLDKANQLVVEQQMKLKVAELRRRHHRH